MIKNKIFKCKYAGIYKDDMSNGIGIGAVLFVQYCTHHCKGCQNPETWDIDGGKEFKKEIFIDLMNYLQLSYVDRFTLSGGDPFDNFELSYYVANNFKKECPNKSLWVYTGYTFESLLQDPEAFKLLEITDILVDGRFEEDKKDLTLPFRGSSNQRIIDVKKSLESNSVVLYEGVK